MQLFSGWRSPGDGFDLLNKKAQQMGFTVSAGKTKVYVLRGQLGEALPPARVLCREINTLESRAEYPVSVAHNKGESRTKPPDKLACLVVLWIPPTRV